MKKRYIILLILFLLICGAIVGYQVYNHHMNKGDVSHAFIDYGKSELYTVADMDSAIKLIKNEFSKWQGCELHTLAYTSDECNNIDQIESLNILAKAKGYKFDLTQVIEFKSDFHSPKVGSLNNDGFNLDFEYTNWRWYLGRVDGGSWILLTWGY